jgi:putative flippase GtrA
MLVGWASVNPMLANLAGIGAATGWNFTLNLCWTWRRPRAVAIVSADAA